jgi:hypothetical protein
MLLGQELDGVCPPPALGQRRACNGQRLGPHRSSALTRPCIPCADRRNDPEGIGMTRCAR